MVVDKVETRSNTIIIIAISLPNFIRRCIVIMRSNALPIKDGQ
jgi:hypothetical protein